MGSSWLIAASILIIALAFVALAIFVISTLLSLKKMVNDLDQKVRAFDPLFRVVNQAGIAIERKAERIEGFSEEFEEALSRKERRKEGPLYTAMEIAEWAVVGLSLWQKFQERRRR